MKIIVLAGGKGTRLWPMSRKTFPKQFMPMKGGTLFRQTVNRCLLIEKTKNIFVSTNQDYLHLVEEGLSGTGIKKDNIIVEPSAKNTGPAILFALKELKKLKAKDDELVFVCPSDHFITPEDEFVKDIQKAQKISSSGHIVTFGIKPNSPEIGYGYIGAKRSSLSVEGNKINFHQVESFIEKPCLEKAQELLKSGKYYWNSGMFLFPMGLMMKEFKDSAPDLIKDISNFDKIRSVSIDNAVIEKSDKIATVPAGFRWSDVGSWESFHQTQEKDRDGNVITGNVLMNDVKNSLIMGNNRLVACFGLENITIIETGDAVFVAPKNRSQEVKSLVENLEKNNKREAYEGLKTNRPWGNYIILGEGEKYKIKKIAVHPKKRLSLQSHKFRSEHWVVIEGKAKVTVNDKDYLLKKGESFFVPLKARHRLENPSSQPLEIIEVQNGNYLGEDDIVRFDDDYGRIKETKKKKK